MAAVDAIMNEDELILGATAVLQPGPAPALPSSIVQPLAHATDQGNEDKELVALAEAAAAAAVSRAAQEGSEEDEEEEIHVRLPHVDPSPSPPSMHAAAASPEAAWPPPPQSPDDFADKVVFVSAEAPPLAAPAPTGGETEAAVPSPLPAGLELAAPVGIEEDEFGDFAATEPAFAAPPLPPVIVEEDVRDKAVGGLVVVATDETAGSPPPPPPPAQDQVEVQGMEEEDDFGDFGAAPMPVSSSPRLPAVPEPPITTTPAVEEEQVKTAEKEEEEEDEDDFGDFGSAPSPPLPAVPEPPTTTTTTPAEQLVAAAATGIGMEKEEEEEDDDFGDFASVPAATAPAQNPPPPPSMPPKQEQSPSSPPPPTPLPVVDATAFFEACFGGDNTSPTDPPSSSADKTRKVLSELQKVDLTQSFSLNRPFKPKASSWSRAVLTKALQAGLLPQEGEGHHHHQEEEEGEEEEEEENRAISIAWAIASPGPSRFNSVSQAPAPAPEEKEEEEEVSSASFAVPKDISLESLPSELDLDFLAGGGSADTDGGGGGGGGGLGVLPQQVEEGGCGESSGSALSRAFFDLGLGPPAGKEDTNAGTQPQQQEEEKEERTASIVLNRGPLSSEAEAVLSGVGLPNFGFMLAKIPIVPSLTSTARPQPQPPRQKVEEEEGGGGGGSL